MVIREIQPFKLILPGGNFINLRVKVRHYFKARNDTKKIGLPSQISNDSSTVSASLQSPPNSPD